MRDPRVDPRAGDVLLMGDGLTYAIIHPRINEFHNWTQVPIDDTDPPSSHMRLVGSPLVEFSTATIIHAEGE